MTHLIDLVRASREVADTSSRSAKIKRIAACLEACDREDIDCVVAWLSGELLQRRTGVGYAALSQLAPPASEPSLAVAEVNKIFEELSTTSGAGSQSRRAALLDQLFGASTSDEQSFLRNLMGGELRQGALAGIMTDAIALAAHLPVAEVRRAAMLQGDLPKVAKLAIGGGKEALSRVHLEVGRGVLPMLAQSATSIDDALAHIEGDVAFEAKLDGARIQVHVKDSEVRFFTRSLDDITQRLSSLVPSILDWPVKNIVVDGEIMSLGSNDKPRPFQETASDVARHADSPSKNQERRLAIFLFDILHLDGIDLIDQPADARRAALEKVVPTASLVERIVTRDPLVARAFYDRIVKSGYEGVIAKSLTAPYEAGRRGAGWLKVKPVHTLDLVVLAVEWGSGRRTGKLSNIHLGARDPKGVS